MYRTSQVYSDNSNPNAKWSQNHLVKELSATLDEDPKRKINISNMHVSVTEYQVIKLFQEHGKIVREQFLWHKGGAKRGEPRGCMLIEYETEKMAATAKEKMNGRLLLGRTMSVRTVDESTSHEDMFGADADWEDKEEGRVRESVKTEQEKLQRRPKSKAEQIAAIRAKLASMKNEDSENAKQANLLGGDRDSRGGGGGGGGGDRYRPY